MSDNALPQMQEAIRDITLVLQKLQTNLETIDPELWFIKEATKLDVNDYMKTFDKLQDSFQRHLEGRTVRLDGREAAIASREAAIEAREAAIDERERRSRARENAMEGNSIVGVAEIILDQADEARQKAMRHQGASKQLRDDVREELEQVKFWTTMFKDSQAEVYEAIETLKHKEEQFKTFQKDKEEQWKALRKDEIDPLLERTATNKQKAAETLRDLQMVLATGLADFRAQGEAQNRSLANLTGKLDSVSIAATEGARSRKRPGSPQEARGSEKRSRSRGLEEMATEAEFASPQSRAIASPVSRSAVVQEQGSSSQMAGEGSSPSGMVTRSSRNPLSIPERLSSVGQGSSSPSAVVGGHQQVLSSQAQLSQPQVSSSNIGVNLDPPDLSSATEEMQAIWRQIQFPSNWTQEDSVKLLSIFIAARRRKGNAQNIQGRYWPRKGMDYICDAHSKRECNHCVETSLNKQAAKWPSTGKDYTKPCNDCSQTGQLCVDVTWIDTDPGEYSSEGTEKRWVLYKRV